MGLKSFLKFYICFPYDTHIICPHFGKKKVKLEVNKKLVIQDPFELTRSVSSVISEAHFSYILSMFEKSYKKLKKGPFIELFDETKVDETDQPLDTEIWSLQNKINLFHN